MSEPTVSRVVFALLGLLALAPVASAQCAPGQPITPGSPVRLAPTRVHVGGRTTVVLGGQAPSPGRAQVVVRTGGRPGATVTFRGQVPARPHVSGRTPCPRTCSDSHGVFVRRVTTTTTTTTTTPAAAEAPHTRGPWRAAPPPTPRKVALVDRLIEALEQGDMQKACRIAAWAEGDENRTRSLQRALYAKLPSPGMLRVAAAMAETGTGCEGARGRATLLRILGDPGEGD